MPFVFLDEQKSTPSGFVFEDADATPATPVKQTKQERSWAQVAGDTGVDAAKGIVGLGESAVGLADLATGNLAGKGLAAVGYDPARTNQILSDLYSDPRQQANRNVSDAKGFVDTTKALIQNPSVIVGGVVESAPMMLGSVGAVRALAAKMLAGAGLTAGTAEAAAFLSNPAVAAKLTLAGSAAEGAMTAGGIQEQGRQAGRDYTDTAPAALAGGALTGAIGVLSSKVPGFKDAEVGMATAGMGGAQRQGLLATGKEIAKGTFKEGVLEEMPQSAQEQVFTNLALGKPWNEGVPEAAAQGIVVGAAQGGGMNVYSAGRNALAAPPVNPTTPPETPSNPATPPAEPAHTAIEPIAKAPDTSAAEVALLAPVALTSLDRVNEIDTELAPVRQRLAELASQEGGSASDQALLDATAQAADLENERAELTKGWPKAVPGTESSFTTEAGARVNAQYALMDAGDLITSHDEGLRKNPLYPPELQPRERDRAASEMQVSGIVQKLDPARLGLSADAANGAPIVGADGLVESGNARTIALKRVYQANGQKAADYKQWLIDNAQQFGITSESVNTMAKPVLVRVRTTPVNRAEFARQANASTVAMMSPSEQAKSDANRIDTMEDLTPDDNGDFSNAASRPFVRRFMARLPMTEQAGMIDSSGNLSTSGYARVRNAVLAKAYGDSPVLARMTESMDDNLRNVSRALMLAAPKVAQMRQAIKSGDRFDADITPDLMASVEELSKIKDDGGSVQDALAQTDIMGDQRTPEARQLLQFLNDNMRRPRRMADFIVAYMDALDAMGDPRQESMFGDTQAPEKADLLTAAEKATQNEVQDSGPKGGGASQEAGAQAQRQPENAQGNRPGTKTDGGGNGSSQNTDAKGQPDAEVSKLADTAAQDLKKNWPEGQQRTEQAVNSPHPLTAEAANPAADSPDTRPVAQSVPTAEPESNPVTPPDATEDRVVNEPTASYNEPYEADLYVSDTIVASTAEQGLDVAKGPVLSRGSGGGMDVKVLEGLAARIKARMPNMPKVHVLASPADKATPKALRDYIEKQGAMDDVDGALHRGELYLFASGLTDALRAEHVLAEHEAAHFGLRAILGDSLKTAMRAIYNNNAAVRQAATELQKRGKLSNAEATEEVIVDIPSSQLVRLKGWRKVVLQARDWLAGHGFDAMAAKLSGWLDGSLSDQQRADLMVANLVLAARAYMAGKRGARESIRQDTMLSGSLAEDAAKQEKWLSTEARARGYADIDELAEKNYPLFEKLAELWRKKNPAENGVLLSRSPMKSVAANIDRGLNALANAITGKTTVHRAMYRNGLGWVDFVWGDEGRVKPSGKTVGAKGLSHILEARMRKDGLTESKAIEVLGELVRTIASGTEFDRKVFADVIRAGIKHDGFVAWLAKRPGANSWIVTGYEVDPDKEAAGRATATSTTSVASRTRDGEGAGSGESLTALSRAGNQGTAAERADKIIQTKAATAKPIDDAPTPDTRLSRSGLEQDPAPVAPKDASPLQKAKAKALSLTNPQALDQLMYDFTDKYIDLKRIRDHIKAIGGTITDLNDAYLGEELYHKRLSKRIEDFLSDEVKPLLADLRARGVGAEEFEQFLHARHAPEANKAMAARNPTQDEIDAGKASAEAVVKALEEQLQGAVARGAATNAIEQSLALAREEGYKWVGAQAFQGTEEERLSLSGMSDAQAQAVMDGLSPAKLKDLQALAARVDAINAKTMDTLEQYGLMDQESLAQWRKAYQFYIPLHRDEAHPDSTSHPIGQGFSVKGDASKRRTGSNAKVTNILGHIAMQREAALTRGEKNTVVKKLYVMAAQNPDAELWDIEKIPTITQVDNKTGFVRTYPDPTYKNKPNVVMVRIAGRDAAIVFNERNPQGVRLAGAMKNMDVGDLGAVLTQTARVTRWFAAVNTQYNPVFGLMNFARDIQAAMLNLSTTPLAGQQAKVAKGVPAALRAVYRAERGKGALSAESAKWMELWEDLQQVGGTTGYRDLYPDAKERTQALVKDLQKLDRGQVSQAAHAVVDWLSDYNDAIENGVRLSAYSAALDQGMSRERAASLSKNLTVNFNRKGAKARDIGALYAFFNAAIQGNARMFETLRGPVGKKIMFGGVALGMITSMLGMAVMGGGDGEDDEWEKVPEFVKERAIVIPMGHKDYMAIPMPLGFHVFPNLGRVMAEWAMGGPDKSLGKQVGKILGTLVDSFNPVGGGSDIGQVIMPTVLDPFLALWRNKDWTGRQIYREDSNSLDPTPGFTRAKDSASTPSKLLSEAINKISGGNEYRPGLYSPTPDQIDYVIGQVTGGLGREILKVEQVLTTPFTGDELPAHKIPVIGRIYGNTRGAGAQSGAFYENVRTLNEVENEVKGRNKNDDDADGYMAREPLTNLIGDGNSQEKIVSHLRKQRKQEMHDQEPGYKDRVKEINTQIEEEMRVLNRAVSRVKRGVPVE